jgi:Holliday junction resolvasome RuvABC ATP-dependent DNA helicase subunit
MGMLLLVSPPGYGKTTLMEYMADRMGLVFMKINGPSIGHDILSTDPNEAKNAGARQELEN